MEAEAVRHHYKILAHLIKHLVAERFKRMAKDESLFRFLSSQVEPALLVDYAQQTEKEALDLAEVGLLKLVNQDLMLAEIQKSARKIQQQLQSLFGDEFSKHFLDEDLIEKRALWLRARIDFYQRMLSLNEKVNDPLELGQRAFRNSKRFYAAFEKVLRSEQDLADEIVQATHSLHRFLMKKHLDHEFQNLENIWNEFGREAFKKLPELE